MTSNIMFYLVWATVLTVHSDLNAREGILNLKLGIKSGFQNG